MKDAELNPLNKKQRKLLQYGVVLMLLVFLVGYFFFITRSKNTTVFIEDSKLHIFDELISIEYPDTLEMQYPYLLVVQPEEHKTRIYNLENGNFEKTVREISLAYFGGKLLYNKGAETYLDNERLGVLCEQGVIKSVTEVLCVTKVSPESSEYKVVSIELDSKIQTDIYESPYLITDIAVISGVVYIGEIDQISRQNYLVIDGKQSEVSNIVSMIYESGGKPYFASLKSALNKESEAYFMIDGDQAVVQNSTRIVLYE